MNRPLMISLSIGLCAVLLIATFFIYVLVASRDVNYWEGHVIAFEHADISNPPPRNAIIFTGADYVRLWPSLETDMAPYTVLKRGLGGAHITHLKEYANRLINIHEPRAVVVSAGLADLSDVGGVRAEDVFQRYIDFFDALRAGDRRPHIYVLALPLPPLKERYWPLIRALNRMMSEYCKTQADIYFVDVLSPMLTRTGIPRSHFFRWDGFHMNEEGYQIWAKVVRDTLKIHEQTIQRPKPETSL